MPSYQIVETDGADSTDATDGHEVGTEIYGRYMLLNMWIVLWTCCG